jgi:3-phenylpropionate/trans-cinnamate dioxygenase ferredoxin component
VHARIPLGPASEFPPGDRRVVHTDVGIISVYNIEGTYHAIDDLCPHMKESLAQGPLDGCVVTCGAHGWRFDVRTGKSPDFEGIEVETFRVDEVDGELFLLVSQNALDEFLDWEGATDPDDIDDVRFD